MCLFFLGTCSLHPSQPALHLPQKFPSGVPLSGAYTQEGPSCPSRLALLRWPRQAGFVPLQTDPHHQRCASGFFILNPLTQVCLCRSPPLCLPLFLSASPLSFFNNQFFCSQEPFQDGLVPVPSPARPGCPASWLFPGIPAPASHSSPYICLLSPGMISEHSQIPGFVFFWRVKAALGCSRCVSEVTSPSCLPDPPCPPLRAVPARVCRCSPYGHKVPLRPLVAQVGFLSRAPHPGAAGQRSWSFPHVPPLLLHSGFLYPLPSQGAAGTETVPIAGVGVSDLSGPVFYWSCVMEDPTPSQREGRAAVVGAAWLLCGVTPPSICRARKGLGLCGTPSSIASHPHPTWGETGYSTEPLCIPTCEELWGWHSPPSLGCAYILESLSNVSHGGHTSCPTPHGGSCPFG